MRLFGYPYNNDLVLCKDSPDYLKLNYKIIKHMPIVALPYLRRESNHEKKTCSKLISFLHRHFDNNDHCNGAVKTHSYSYISI